MSKTDRIYHIVSLIGFWLHIFVFVFVLIVSFLPFKGNKNFYEFFADYSSSNISIFQPYFSLPILFLAYVAALLAIKFPLLSLLEVVCTFSFFMIVAYPYIIEAFFDALFYSPLPTYGIGFQLLEAVSYITYFDIAFFIYSIIIFFIRLKNKIDTDKLMQWFFPDNIISEKTKAAIKNNLSIFVILLVSSLIIGLYFISANDIVFWNIGRYMILILLGIIILLVFVVVVVKIISHFKGNTSESSEENY